MNRRNVLKGSGAILALPFLESLATPVGPRAAAEHPMRMVCIGLEYGLYPKDFFPTETGRDYQIPKLLKPLSSVREAFSVFSNLDHPGVTGGHYAEHTFLSGIKSDHAPSQPEGNITVDQKAAEFVGARTRFPSMQLGLGGGGVSWTRNGVEIPPITRLQTMFDALILEAPEAKRRRLSETYKMNGSILDVVRDDAADLKRRSGRKDLEKLDEFFTSIRQVEKHLSQSEAWLQKPKPKTDYRLPDPVPTRFYEEVPLFYDLIKLALQTDSTRVVSMGINGWRGASGLPGVTKGYHYLTHHGRDEERLKQLSIIETYHTAQFARFIDRLKQTPASSEASLLDRTMVLFGSGLGNASSHSNRNLPILLAGGGFAHGEHKAYPNADGRKTPACNLFVSMLQKFGLEVDRFGTSTGTLEGLS
ncbi:MAG: DUF1552 domain-containing protein [Verrucomicrobiota bacterium]